MGDSVRITHPVTVDIFFNVFQHLHWSNQLHICMHAFFLVAIFSFLRISNLVPYALDDCHSNSVYFLRRQDVSITASGTVIRVYRTKTLQFKQRELEIPLPFIPNSVLCPVTALNRYLCTEPTVSVTNVVTHNLICPLTPFNVEVIFMFMHWSAKGNRQKQH